MPEEFENAALFLWLFLPSTVICYKNGAFCSHVDGKHFKNGVFGKRCGHNNRDFPGSVFLKHKCQITGDCCVFEFLRHNLDKKHLMHLQSETSIFTFFQHRDDTGR